MSSRLLNHYIVGFPLYLKICDGTPSSFIFSPRRTFLTLLINLHRGAPLLTPFTSVLLLESGNYLFSMLFASFSRTVRIRSHIIHHRGFEMAHTTEVFPSDPELTFGGGVIQTNDMSKPANNSQSEGGDSIFSFDGRKS